jgi:diguanylate cyclase (GGDEF)-like protein
VTINNENVSVTVTIGYRSLCSPTTDDAEQLIKSADNALYSGKKMGRNQVVDFDQIHKPH